MGWLNKSFERFALTVTRCAGSSWAFGIAVLIVVVWAVTGPLFHYSDAWQLVINTGTTIVTFLMVFLIQHSQNKDSLAIQIKLNELLAAVQGASNELINVEDMSAEQIENLHHRFAELSQQLEQAADDCSSHSISEAQGALEEFHQVLKKPRQKASHKRSARRLPRRRR